MASITDPPLQVWVVSHSYKRGSTSGSDRALFASGNAARRHIHNLWGRHFAYVTQSGDSPAGMMPAEIAKPSAWRLVTEPTEHPEGETHDDCAGHFAGEWVPVEVIWPEMPGTREAG